MHALELLALILHTWKRMEEGGAHIHYTVLIQISDIILVCLSGVHRYIYVACAIHILMCYIQLAIQQCILVYYIPSAYVVCYVWAPKQTFVVSFLSRPHAQFLIIMRPHERHQQWHITCSQRTPLRTPFSQDSQRVIGLAWVTSIYLKKGKARHCHLSLPSEPHWVDALDSELWVRDRTCVSAP